MRFRAARVFTVASLAAAFIGVGAGTAWAGGPVCSVPGEYATIQAAVNEPGCTTINVAAGTYTEQVDINRTLTLNGAQHGVDARSRSGASGTESIMSDAKGPVRLEANNVTINGFTIEGTTEELNAGIWIPLAGVEGTQILDNIIQSNVLGIYLNNNGATMKVEDNLIRHNNNPGPSSGSGTYSEALSDALVENNEFTEDNSGSMTVIGPAEHITISNNQLVGSDYESIFFLGVKESTIHGNTSIGTKSASTIDMGGGDSKIEVTDNVLRNGYVGISAENPYAAGVNSEITATGNCIAGNSVAGLGIGALEEGPPVSFKAEPGVYMGSLAATNNWWGSASGPTIASNPGGTGQKIIDEAGAVEYAPYAITSTLAQCIVAPTVTGVSPNSASARTIVTVTGTGFVPGSSSTRFSFTKTVGRKHKHTKAKLSKAVNCASATSCAVLVPGGTGTVDVIATVEGQSSAINRPGDQFTYN
jgi:nitrous oxidase accessory protein NosD